MNLTKSFFSLLALINPTGAIPSFISPTESQTGEEKRRIIKVASISVAIVIGLPVSLDEQIANFFGFSVGLLQVGGEITMTTIALNMLSAQTSHIKATSEEEDEVSIKAGIAVVLPATPLLTGPGSTSTIIVYADRTEYQWDPLLLAGASVAIVAVVWVILRAAEPITHVTGHTDINIGTCLMGLILAVLTVEFIADGLKTLLPASRA